VISRRYHPGPLVLLAVLATTCLLLVLFQKVLWLVIPFLFALIAYYLVLPLKQRLVLAGVSHDAAAIFVTLALLLVLGLLALFSMPWLSTHMSMLQAGGGRYLEGGMRFLGDTLNWMEATFSFAARAHLAQDIMAHVNDFNEHFASRYMASAAMMVAVWFPSLLLIPFLAFFMLRDGWRFKRFLSRAVPNAFFERTLFLLDQLDHTARSYFQGLIKLTVLDALCLAAGLSFIGVSSPLLLGVLTAILAWIPYVGSIGGCLLVVLVAATDYPGNPSVAYAAIVLFIAVRLLDDFFFMPMTIGKSLKMHPLLTVLMIFAGGAVAGVAGLVLVLPLLGIVMVLGETLGAVLSDPRLRARHRFAKSLLQTKVTQDLRS
jgi:predicted PurR-regulated permease PerM